MIVFTKPCEKCGVDVRSDEEHQCRAQKSKPARKPTTSPVTKTEMSKSISPSIRRIDPPPVATPDVATSSVATKPVATETERVATWRTKNRERYNARMRAYRAAAKKAPE